MTKELAEEILSLHEQIEQIQERNDKLYLWFVSALLASDGKLPKYLFDDHRQRDKILRLREDGLEILLFYGNDFHLCYKSLPVSTTQVLELLK